MKTSFDFSSAFENMETILSLRAVTEQAGSWMCLQGLRSPASEDGKYSISTMSRSTLGPREPRIRGIKQLSLDVCAEDGHVERIKNCL